MATKAKDIGIVGKEKKGLSSNSPITSTKRTTSKPSTTSSTNKATSNPSEKQIPNYLKPTISSVCLDSHSSFKLYRNDAPTKPTLNRRRSFDPSSSMLPKQTQPSLSRQHKALVSPGPRDRTLTRRSSSVPIKTTNNPSKPISERLLKTPKEGRTQPLITKSTKKSSPSVLTSTTKKVMTDDVSTNLTNASTSNDVVETIEAITVEIESGVKEVINEEVGEVEKLENQELPCQVVDSKHEHEHDHQERDQKLEESDQPHVQLDDEKVIPTVLDEEQIEDDNTNQDECNINENHIEIDHSTTQEEVEIKEKEQGQEQEDGVIIEKDHKSEEEVMEEKEEVEERISEEVKEFKEGQDEDEQVESEVKEEKVEPTKPKQLETGGGVLGKKEFNPQVSNDVIEETAGKLLDLRKNKVRALAGAFQTVIDHQTK